jgi:dienelactone hydrolase
MLAQYFRDETARIGAQAFAGINTLEDWNRQRPVFREQLLEMLGLSPLPERTDLKATVTGRLDHAAFTVENLHFQSLPGLYVTANLYVPKALAGKKVPAILYVCGHANVKEGGASMGNKTGYQHHGAWFARHGYVCLTIDTIQLGELEGVHHGTHNRGMYWWNSRGYTPAGVEAWNGVRAIDYLQSRPEVDGTKIGITGRSGGGAYSWYTAAIDERIKAAVPVAGITDLHNHVIDGTVKGHCDCMFMLNTYRWDYAQLAAMIAPRPLLIANSDKDSIFPLEGVQRVHRAVAKIYQLHHAPDKLGLLITEGPHKDTQDLQVPAFRWFNRFLKGEDPLIQAAAEKYFTPKQLRVFPVGGHPADERTTKIHETFVPMAAPAVPTDAGAWQRQREAWLEALRTRSFAGWPTHRDPPNLAPVGGRLIGKIQEATWEFTSQGVVRLPWRVFYTGEPKDVRKIVLHVADERDWAGDGPPAPYAGPIERGELALLLLAPRGIGPTASTAPAVDQNHLRRRYLLLGQTVDGMRVWDICRAIDAIRSSAYFTGQPIHLAGSRHQAINALYAALFLDGLAGLELHEPPASHVQGPDYLNVLRFLDVPQAVAMAAERQPVALRGANRDDWSWTLTAARQLGWPAERLQW